MEEYFQNSKKRQPRGVYFNFRKFLPGIQQSEISSRESGPLWTSHPINHCTLKSKMASILLEVMVAFKDISAILPTFQFDHSVRKIVPCVFIPGERRKTGALLCGIFLNGLFYFPSCSCEITRCDFQFITGYVS